MKQFISIVTFGVCLLAISPAARAQNCSNWTNWDLRGTYTMSGSGYVDLSKLFPGMGLPAGAVPMFWVGAFVHDGKGGGTGWVSLNGGGGQMHAQLVGLTYSMEPDCSVQISFSMQFKETGTTIGPIQRLAVVVPTPGALELHMILVGSGPGNPPAPGFDLGVAHRISLQY